eukprot:11157396-Lingulodinium_polyedra.AAC.1
MERAGIAELYRRGSIRARALVRQVGANTHAKRQDPFSAWERGDRGCGHAARFPGQRASPRQSKGLGRISWRLSEDALAAFERTAAAIAQEL